MARQGLLCKARNLKAFVFFFLRIFLVYLTFYECMGPVKANNGWSGAYNVKHGSTDKKRKTKKKKRHAVDETTEPDEEEKLFILLVCCTGFYTGKLGLGIFVCPLCTKAVAFSLFAFCFSVSFLFLYHYPVVSFLFSFSTPYHVFKGFVERRGYGWRCCFCAFSLVNGSFPILPPYMR